MCRRARATILFWRRTRRIRCGNSSRRRSHAWTWTGRNTWHDDRTAGGGGPADRRCFRGRKNPRLGPKVRFKERWRSWSTPTSRCFRAERGNSRQVANLSRGLFNRPLEDGGLETPLLDYCCIAANACSDRRALGVRRYCKLITSRIACGCSQSWRACSSCPSGCRGYRCTAVGVRIPGFESAQPKNPRHDRIASRRIGDQDFASGPAILENHPARRRIADLLCNLQLTERRPATTGCISNRESGRRDWIGGDQRAVIQQGEFLFRDAYDDAMARVRRDAGLTRMETAARKIGRRIID